MTRWRGSTTRAGCASSPTTVRDTLHVVMRVYFEKPRTSTGWKGFINDPRMDDSFHIEEGMERGRRFLLDVAELGLPAATEALDPIAPQYYGDLDLLDGDRRAHRGVPDAPRDGLGTVDAGGLQERHRRLPGGGGQRHPLRLAPAQLPGAQRAGRVGHHPDPRQRLRPPGAAGGRRAAQLRHGVASRSPSRRSPRRSCRATSSSTARTPTPGRSRSCSRW